MLSFLHFLLEVISFLWLILTLGCFKVHAALDLHKGPDLDMIELTDN